MKDAGCGMRVAGCEKAIKILAQRSKAEDGKLRVVGWKRGWPGDMRKLSTLADGPWEPYDIEANRTEMHDLAGAQPEVVEVMGKIYERWAVKVGAAAPKDAHVSRTELPKGLVAD